MAKKYIDADRLKQTIADNVYPVQDAFNSRDYGMFWTGGIEKAIDEQPAADVAPRWIPVTEKLPETIDPVNITWVNRNPSRYNEHIKDKPFVATGHYCNGRWYWFSAVCQDYLNEYSDCEMDRIASAIEVIAWMPLPEPYKGGGQNG